MKTVKVFVALLLVATLLCGCASLQQEQTVTCGELSIALPNSFEDWSDDPSADGLSFSYANTRVGVCGVFESKEYLQAYFPDLDAKQYAELFVETNGLTSTIEVVDGIPSFTYTAEGSPTFQYLCGVFESGENFWVVQTYCNLEDFEEYQGDMWNYIASVSIT